MGWFGKKAPAPAPPPTRWTPELWSDVAWGSTTHFDAAVVIRAMKESGEWIYASLQMDHGIEYLGRLERLPGHPLGDVPVDLRFNNGTQPAGVWHGDSQTLGMVYMGAYGDERTGFLLLSVRIWGDAAGAAAFEAAFMRALAGGEDGLRVWLWAYQRAPEIPSTASGFAASPP